MAGRAGRYKLFFADPLDGCSLHFASWKDFPAFQE
jgi:hypothetical protein